MAHQVFLFCTPVSPIRSAKVHRASCKYMTSRQTCAVQTQFEEAHEYGETGNAFQNEETPLLAGASPSPGSRDNKSDEAS